MSDDTLTQLAFLLKKRLAIIADHALRDRDPKAHLAQLQEVSEALFSLHREVKESLPPRLHHFLTQGSYDKALAYLERENPSLAK